MSDHKPEMKTDTKRKKALTAISIVVLLGLAYGGVEWFLNRHFEETDNAYVQGNIVQITPQISGTVTSVLVDDTDNVKAGQPLVQLDPADAQVALNQAQAQWEQTVRQVRGLYASNSSLQAQVALREADVGKVQTEIVRARDDWQRRQELVKTGAVSQEELNHSRSQFDSANSALAAAKAAVLAAKEQLASNQTLTSGTSAETHPSVQAAAAKVQEAKLATQRTTLLAPVDGQIAKRSVQLGQRVAAGVPLMSVIALKQIWVEANFKEVQLRHIRLGQPALLTADVYGKKVQYHGKVAGVGAGTGAAFSLLPAQNATGNWIKVVQRVPVRIALDAQELEQNPLRIGLSMEVTVDVGNAQ